MKKCYDLIASQIKCQKGCWAKNNMKAYSWIELQHVEKKTLEMQEESLNSLVINEFECIHLLYQVKVVVMEEIVVKIDGQ